jgi:diguanylate cyclase (GGDEF)-like protein/PAS domain S-box-containing protein
MMEFPTLPCAPAPAAFGIEHAVLDALAEPAALLDRCGLIVLANACWQRCAPAAGAGPRLGVGDDYLAYWCAAEHAGMPGAAATRAALEAVLTGLKERSELELAMPPNAQARRMRMTVSALAGHPQRILVLQCDITSHYQTEMALRISAAAFETGEGKMITDAQGTLVQVNQAFCAITGYAPEEVLGKTPAVLSSGRQGPAFYADMWAALREIGCWQGELWNRRKNGDVYAESLHIDSVRDGSGCISHYVASMSDITFNKAAGDQIRTLAFYDPLTGLPNRRLLLERLELARAACALSGRTGALLTLDLDNFKTLNDTLGHHAGDLLLQQVAQRLPGCLRHAGVVARLGGDEFVLLAEGLSGLPFEAAAEARALAMAVRDALATPYALGAAQYHISASIGIALFDADQDATAAALLQQADIAMHQAKQAGSDDLRFFDPCMQRAINVRAAMETALRQALDLHEFTLHYQVQVDRDGCATGAEALLRWRHPPASFIPVAEETGLILPIGTWVIDQACAQLGIWRTLPALAKLALAVNISARQFHQRGFCEQVLDAVMRHGVDPALLKLELTEGILIDNIDDTIVTLKRLRSVGIRFSLDDFGTGYSSLQYLKRLPLDQLKIDQSFVRDLVSDPSDQAIVKTIIAMANSLGLDVIAEGVEHAAQKDLLEHLGCHQFQGYLYGRAVDADTLAAMLTPPPPIPYSLSKENAYA